MWSTSKSIVFYQEALGLNEIRRKEAKDGSFIIVFMGDGNQACLGAYVASGLAEGFLRSRLIPCLTVDDYEGAYKKHKGMGCIAYENEAMGLYFITDPDGYWIEIIPPRP